ncbi:ATP-dependent DNA helicase Pif1-like [Xylocopa sonorina]|uniref:ATP-dependent DNA helicase Pif1-like n=1 Tax=Xylocopa sonorina TaxID=1818115 RepID=UPI00403B1433
MQVIETPTCNISKYFGMGKVLRSCQLVIWEECTMAHKKSLEALNRALKNLRGNGQLFGGALILLAGDFRQTLPVIPRSAPADELNAYESSERFEKQLLDIGNGKIEMDGSTHCITLPENFCHIAKSIDELIAKVFPNVSQNYKNNQWVSERAILAAKNIRVNLINCTIQNEIPDEETTYKSIYTVVNHDESVNYPIEFFNSLDLQGMPPLQFPVRLAFAMTINKVQGQSLQVCGLNWINPCFSHGQLYVGCSRVGKPSNLFILAPDRKTNNVVYLQALLSDIYVGIILLLIFILMYCIHLIINKLCLRYQYCLFVQIQQRVNGYS